MSKPYLLVRTLRVVTFLTADFARRVGGFGLVFGAVFFFGEAFDAADFLDRAFTEVTELAVTATIGSGSLSFAVAADLGFTSLESFGPVVDG